MGRERSASRSWLRRGRSLGEVFGDAAVLWWRDDAFQLAAALAFYTVFSLAPLIVIAIAVAGFAFGHDVAVRALVNEMNALVGGAGGAAVRSVVENAATSHQGAVATVIGVAAVGLGATAVFAQLQSALNRIWDVKAVTRRGRIGALVRGRLVGFALALGAGFLLIVSLLVSAALSATQEQLTRAMPDWPWLWRSLELGASLLLITGLFMTVYKTLPDVEISWPDVAIGGLVSALLFLVGKFAIGLYLGRLSIGHVYGAAGSFAVLLVWVYYTALLCFYGAEFTQVYARRFGSRIRPSSYAERRARASEPIAAGVRRG